MKKYDWVNDGRDSAVQHKEFKWGICYEFLDISSYIPLSW